MIWYVVWICFLFTFLIDNDNVVGKKVVFISSGCHKLTDSWKVRERKIGLDWETNKKVKQNDDHQI